MKTWNSAQATIRPGPGSSSSHPATTRPGPGSSSSGSSQPATTRPQQSESNQSATNNNQQPTTAKPATTRSDPGFSNQPATSRMALLSVLNFILLFYGVQVWRFFSGNGCVCTGEQPTGDGAACYSHEKLYSSLISPYFHKQAPSNLKHRPPLSTVDPIKWIITLSLLLGGDIHPCPGPRIIGRKDICPLCEKTVRKNNKAVACDICDKFIHNKCGGFLPFVCNACSLRAVANPECMDCSVMEDKEALSTPASPIADQFACFQRRGLHLIHVNARSLIPKLDEIKSIATRAKAAVLAVTESWLDDSAERGTGTSGLCHHSTGS